LKRHASYNRFLHPVKTMAGSFTMASLPKPSFRPDGAASFVSGADQNEIDCYPSWKTRSFEYASWKPSSESEGSTQADLDSSGEFNAADLMPPGDFSAKQEDMKVSAPDYSSMLQMQMPDGHYMVPMMMMPMPMMQQAPMMASPFMVMPMPQQHPSDAVANISPVPRSDTKATSNTTVMWRNIPNNYSRDNLLALIDSHGFAGSYDFFYAPLDFSSNALVGYAFLNFVNTADADRFFCDFQGFTQWSLKSEKKSQVTWSQPLQGLQGHIERYRNSAVMHPDVSDDKKPVLFNQGQRVAFPMPTKTIRAPHLRECRPRGE